MFLKKLLLSQMGQRRLVRPRPAPLRIKKGAKTALLDINIGLAQKTADSLSEAIAIECEMPCNRKS